MKTLLRNFKLNMDLLCFQYQVEEINVLGDVFIHIYEELL